MNREELLNGAFRLKAGDWADPNGDAEVPDEVIVDEAASLIAEVEKRFEPTAKDCIAIDCRSERDIIRSSELYAWAFEWFKARGGTTFTIEGLIEWGDCEKDDDMHKLAKILAALDAKGGK